MNDVTEGIQTGASFVSACSEDIEESTNSNERSTKEISIPIFHHFKANVK